MDVVKNSQNGTPNGSAMEPTRRETQPRAERARVVAPAVDVWEGESAILVLADLPGVAADDLTVRVEKDELFVQARRRDLAGETIELRRVFAVPPDVDAEAIGAELARGVLTLTLPRKASAKPRQITVRTG